MDLNDRSELEGLAPTLAAMAKVNPFVVPEGYFEHLSNQLNSQIKIEELAHSNAFETPAGYFESLSENINSAIFLESLKEENASEGFSVPAGYFEHLSQKINKRTEVKKSASKVVRLRFIQYAAAACITIAIGAGLYLNNFYSATRSAEKAISEIPDEEIINYLQMHSDAADTPLILEHLHATDADGQSAGGDLTEEELQHFLDTKL
jgi:hypothetical protein